MDPQVIELLKALADCFDRFDTSRRPSEEVMYVAAARARKILAQEEVSDELPHMAASASASAAIAPWLTPPLNEWQIVGMYHFHEGDERRISVAMAKRERCIIEDGPDDQRLWDRLAERIGGAT